MRAAGRQNNCRMRCGQNNQTCHLLCLLHNDDQSICIQLLLQKNDCRSMNPSLYQKEEPFSTFTRLIQVFRKKRQI